MDGLAALAKETLAQDPFSGTAQICCNAQRGIFPTAAW
jgi:hypothetical protein